MVSYCGTTRSAGTGATRTTDPDIAAVLQTNLAQTTQASSRASSALEWCSSRRSA